MDISKWSRQNCISISRDDLQQDEILAYIKANSNKIYLFPTGENFSDICPRSAEEIELPCTLKFIGAAGEVEVNFLSEILENAFTNSGRNFLLLPENFSDIKNKILRQCALLKIPLEIYTDEEFKIVNATKILTAKADVLLEEIDAAKNFRDCNCNLKLDENISLFNNFFDALNKLQNFLTVAETDLKIAVIGENLTAILKRVNLDTVNLPANIDAEKLSEFDAVIFEIDSQNFSVPNIYGDKIIFAVNIPALADEGSENFAQVLREFQNKFSENLIFVIEAANIFYDEKILTFAETGGNLYDIEKIIDKFNLMSRESFFLKMSLEKFLNNVPPDNEKILQKTGVPYLKNFLLNVNRKNLAATENLLLQINSAFKFLDNGAWQKIYSAQIQNLKISALQAKISQEKILSEIERGKNIFGNTAIKAALYEVETAIKNFAFSLEEIAGDFISNVVRAENFSENVLSELSGGDIPAEISELLSESENIFRTDAEKLLKNLNAEINKISENLPKISIDFAKFFAKNISAKNLQSLVLQNTKIFCLDNVDSGDWKNYKVECFYLSANFSRALSQNLKLTADKKISAIADDLRQKISDGVINYFSQASKNYSAHCEKICNELKTAIQKINDDKNNLAKDAAVIEKLLPNFEKFMALWREIFPAVNSENISNLTDEILKFEDFPATEKFVAPKIPARKITASNVDISQELNAAKAELYNKNFESAFELFTELATHGNNKAAAYLAYMYQKGYGTEENLETAIKLYLEAFYLGNNDAAGELGDIFKDNENFLHALEWYKIGAACGSKYCQKIFK